MFYRGNNLQPPDLKTARQNRDRNHMKHILSILTAALALATTNLFAADVYDVDQIWYTNEQNQGMGEGSYYQFKLSSNSKIYLTDFLNNVYSGNQTETFGAMGIKEYGYYLNGDKNNLYKFSTANSEDADSYSYWDEDGEKQTYTRQKYYLGDFKANDTVEIWLSDGTTEVSTYTPVEGEYTSRWLARTDALDSSLPIAQLTMYNSTGYQVNFGLLTAASDLPPSPGGETFGSPLPGGLQVALIASLFGLGFWYVRRRKAIAG